MSAETPLTDEQKASFRAYAESSMTEADGSQCQWADYTIRLLDECAQLRADLAAAQEDAGEWKEMEIQRTKELQSACDDLMDERHEHAFALCAVREEFIQRQSALRGARKLVELQGAAVRRAEAAEEKLARARRELRLIRSCAAEALKAPVTAHQYRAGMFQEIGQRCDAALATPPAAPEPEHLPMGAHAAQWCVACSGDRPMVDWVPWPCKFVRDPAPEPPAAEPEE